MIRFTPLFLVTSTLLSAPIDRVWLTHGSGDPSKIVVNWETEVASNSVVEYDTSEALSKRVASEEKVKLHHVEIPLEQRDVIYHYRVRSGEDASAPATFKGYSSTELRIAIVGDWGYAPGKDVGAIQKDDVHLLISVGDNVSSLHESGKEGTKAFSALIDAYPALFRSTPFMPILGNHDREITSRGPKPPAHPVYDVEATAYRAFFALPGDEWKWRFDLPDFSLRFLALDASHTKDLGTTWQTNHPITRDSEQFAWYAKEVERKDAAFVLTLNNEQNSLMRGYDHGAWLPYFRQSSALITGYGYFGERADANGLPCFNTCLKGNGDLYKDPQSKFVTREDNYLLLNAKADAPTLKIQIKSLRGETLDTFELPKR